MENKKEYVAVGGQALMEGIMMRGPKGTAVALRMPDGSIETEMKDFVSIRKKYKFFNLPLIRGVVSFIESLVLGYSLLMESAEKTSLDLEESETDSKLDKWIIEHFGEKMMAVIGTISVVLGFALSFFLFMWLPSFLFDLINNHIFTKDLSTIRALFEGVIRIFVFVGYMFATSKMSEIHRVYQYHGAEHKTIFCFEHGKDLTVENIRKEGRFHPRCGTSFIFVTIILSVLISSLVAVCFPSLTTKRVVWILAKILLLPLIMGIGFEFIQLAGKYPNKFTKALSAPGLAMQRITTAEPDDKIIEVAIESMKAALYGLEEKKSGESGDSFSEQEKDSGEGGDPSSEQEKDSSEDGYPSPAAEQEKI